jgi:hypothetical protein
MENNKVTNKMNIVTKTLTTLPEEVCNIIYEYYKLPFLDEIQNPFNKYKLKSNSFFIDRNTNKFCEPRIHPDPRIRTKTYYFSKDYETEHDKYRRTIFGKQRKFTNSVKEFAGYLKMWWQDPDQKHNARIWLKHLCRENGIEITDRTQSKTLIKRLMKV